MTTTRTDSARPALGGASTIYGIVYQLLWSLLECHRLWLREVRCLQGVPHSATVVLEPRDGGDLHVEAGAARIVDQVKARSSGGTWSLRELIEKVLPDLYGSVRVGATSKYRLVTEGRAGAWQGFTNLAAKIAGADCNDPPGLDLLDDQHVAYGSKRGAFWESETYTERSLFEFIAGRIREGLRLEEAETLEESHRKLWLLLAGFEIVPMRTAKELEQRIDRHLEDLVEAEDVRSKRRELLGAMAECARANAELTPRDVFDAARLTSVPLGEREVLLDNARRSLGRHLQSWRYAADVDVRRGRGVEAARVSGLVPILGICGESGIGKSWLGYAASQSLMDAGGLVIHVDSSGDVERDLERAAKTFWEDVAQRDIALSLGRMAYHLARVDPTRARLLTIVLDGIRSPEEAHALIRQTWEAWRVGLVAVLSPDAGEVLRRDAGDRCKVLAVAEFTTEERAEYLSRRLGEAWHGVPDDVLRLLKRPLIAHLYCELAGSDGWRPENEYELFERFWAERLETGMRGAGARVRVGLVRLARTVLDHDGEEPRRDASWNETECLQEFGDGDAFDAALQSGWLLHIGADRYEFAHDRLLNWCVAKALTESERQLHVARLCDNLRDIERQGARFAGRYLGYVALDVVWMLTRGARASSDDVAAVLRALEGSSGATGALYEGTVRTVGRQVAPALLVRLRQEAEEDYLPLVNSIVGAIAEVGGSEVRATALEWLSEEAIGVRAAAVRLLEVFPNPSAADALWRNLCELHRSDDRSRAHIEGNHCRKALAACVAESPDWIRRQVRAARPDREPVYALAALLLGIPDGAALWRELKPILKEKICPRHEYVLALNARCHGDLEEVSWLREKIREEKEDEDSGVVGGVAFDALLTLDTDVALEDVGQLSNLNLYLHRAHGFQRLLELRPAETLASIKARMDASSDHLFLLQIFQGRENGMDEEIAQRAMDLLARDLRRGAGGDEQASRKAERCMRLLACVNGPRLLAVFEACAGGEHEEALVAWLQHVGPRTSIGEDRDRKEAMLLLDRMGGQGLTETCNAWLESSSKYAVFDASDHAHKRPDGRTRDLLARICAGEEPVDSQLGNSYQAFLLLARMGAWNEVVRGLLNPDVGYPHLFAELWKERCSQPPLSDEVLEPARRAALDPSGPVGALGALGVSGRIDLAPILREALEAAEPGSLRSRIALFGYCRLQPVEGMNLDVLRAQLAVPEHREFAIRELEILGSGEALDVLAGELDRKYDDDLAGFLVRKERTRGRAQQLMWEHVRRESPRHAPPGVEHLASLEDPELREYLREHAFESISSFGSAASQGYIRALARFDPAGSFLAARRRVESASGPERAEHVRLLVNLDAPRATSILLDLIETEDSILFLKAVADVVGGVRQRPEGVSEELDGRLLDWLGSNRSALRSRACRLVGCLRAPEEAVALLPSLLKDPDGSVADAAWDAIGELRRAEALDGLLELAAGEDDGDRRRRLVDCCLERGNVGLVGPAPDWLQRKLDEASFLRWKELAERARKLREEDWKVLREQDRKGR